MKTILVSLLLLFAVTVFGQEWLTDFESARALSAEERKPIILVFQGSDWCAPCIKLDNEIWSTEEFRTYSADHFIMLKADFPRKKKNALPKDLQEHNNALAEAYNKSGYFPYVVVLDADGNVRGSTGYKHVTPGEYISLLESFSTEEP